MDKRKITLTVIGVAVLLVVLVGATYAYWTLNSETKISDYATIQTGGLILRLDDVNGITSNDVIDPNHLSFSKYFSITNESAADGYAKLLFKGLTNTFVTDALVYDLEEVQNDKASFATPKIIITNQVLPKGTSINATLADGLLVEKGTIGQNNTITSNTKYYKLTVRYKYSDTVNQSQDLNQTLVSGFTMEEGQSSVTESITFDSKGGLTTPSNISATMGSTYGSLPNVKKTRYIFDGWYTDELYTEKVTSESKVLKSGNHALYAKWVETELPEGYTQLDYLSSTGVQYIDTELNPAGIPLGIDITYQLNEIGEDKWIVGSYSTINNYAYSYEFGTGSSTGLVIEAGSRGSNYIFPFIAQLPPDLNKHNYKGNITNYGSSFDNEVIHNSNGADYGIILSNASYPLYIFGRAGTSSNWYAKVKIYDLKFYNGEELLRHYIPAKRSDNTIGMYDVVRNRFFTNLGTGADFTPGEELW